MKNHYICPACDSLLEETEPPQTTFSTQKCSSRKCPISFYQTTKMVLRTTTDHLRPRQTNQAILYSFIVLDYYVVLDATPSQPNSNTITIYYIKNVPENRALIDAGNKVFEIPYSSTIDFKDLAGLERKVKLWVTFS